MSILPPCCTDLYLLSYLLCVVFSCAVYIVNCVLGLHKSFIHQTYGKTEKDRHSSVLHFLQNKVYIKINYIFTALRRKFA